MPVETDKKPTFAECCAKAAAAITNADKYGNASAISNTYIDVARSWMELARLIRG